MHAPIITPTMMHTVILTNSLVHAKRTIFLSNMVVPVNSSMINVDIKIRHHFCHANILIICSEHRDHVPYAIATTGPMIGDTSILAIIVAVEK